MRAVDIIARKRDGMSLTSDEIGYFIKGHVKGEIPDYQVAALLMAIYLRGMTAGETLALTAEMLHSGVVVNLSSLGRPCIDKHSTGGVGDKTSLVIAPVVAAAGVPVPMISGRALAHSGGTLDKLESIPGFRTNLSLEEFRSNLEEVGAALIGQTAEIAPADNLLYALRDVTATVGCLPLMAASIMSKKVAEGIKGLVLDVKVGNGAFIEDEAEATSLAQTMIEIAKGMNIESIALVTDMNQPLGRAVGNSLEVREALDTLRGGGPEDFNFLCRELSAEMLVLARATLTLQQGRETYDKLIGSGAALAKMGEIIQAQGGNARVLDRPELFPTARHERTVFSRESGYVQTIDTESVGRASMLLGAGRLLMDSRIDPAVGLRVYARIGDTVKEGSQLATLYFNDAELADEAQAILERAYSIGPNVVEPPQLIRGRITNSGQEQFR